MTTTTSRIDVEQAAPELYRAMLRLDGAVAKSGLDPQLQDLLKFRVAQMNGCAYCMDMHGRDAVTGGERPERLYVVAGWREAGELFDERERAEGLVGGDVAAVLVAERLRHADAGGGERRRVGDQRLGAGRVPGVAQHERRAGAMEGAQGVGLRGEI